MYGSIPGIVVGLSEIPYELFIEEEIKELGLVTEGLKESIKKNKHNNLSCVYYLLLQRYLRSHNKSLGSYFSEKTNMINRYNYIVRVKATVDRKIREKIEQKEIKPKSDGPCRKGIKSTEKKGRIKNFSTNTSKKLVLTEEKLTKGKKRCKSLAKATKLNFWLKGQIKINAFWLKHIFYN